MELLQAQSSGRSHLQSSRMPVRDSTGNSIECYGFEATLRVDLGFICKNDRC